MSWSVSANGKVSDVLAEMERQFAYPLAEAPAGLADEGERETVRLVKSAIVQCLGTFGVDKIVIVAAHGHLGYDDWTTKTGVVQTVNVMIQP